MPDVIILYNLPVYELRKVFTTGNQPYFFNGIINGCLIKHHMKWWDQKRTQTLKANDN